MATPITSQQVARLRMQALGLAGAQVDASPLDVVRRHLAMQSQDWAWARWAIGSRIEGSTDADILAAFDRGELVRSWPMRGTVHVMVAEDLRWMLHLAGPRALVGVERRWNFLGIDEAMLERAREAVIAHMRGGRIVTRDELAAVIGDSGYTDANDGRYHPIWYLSQTGTLVYGPTRDGEPLIALLDEWIPAEPLPERDELLHRLAARYLAAHGPASVDDLVGWTKLPKGECKRAIASLGDAAIELDRDGAALFMLRECWDAFDPDLPAANATRALAAFDEHILGYKDRIDVMEPELLRRIVPGSNGIFRPTLVREGRVIGTWKRTVRAKATRIDVEPFVRVTKQIHTEIEQAFERFGTFTGAVLDVRVP